MKYRVIGWVCCDDPSFENAPATDAAVFAIIDDIKENGYIFSGKEHRSFRFGAPLLNDGKRRCFSARAFGEIMAIAHGHYGRLDSSAFTFGMPPEKLKMPTEERTVTRLESVSEESLNETFCIYVSERELFAAVAMRALGLPDVPALRRLDCGDTLMLTAGKKERALTVSSVSRERCYDGGAPFSTLTIEFEKDE